MSIFFVKLKPAELYTHTHTHTGDLLIAFLSTIFIVSGAFADPDIYPYDSTADCDNSTLQTYSGTSNLQANWRANTISVGWYNGNDLLGVSDCQYDGALNFPPTIPTREGYTFKGWQLRSCGIYNLNKNTSQTWSAIKIGEVCEYYNGDTGDYNEDCADSHVAGLNNGEWAMGFSYGVIRGISKCSNTGSWYGQHGTPDDTDGPICWCAVTAFTPSGENQCDISTLSWVVGSTNYNDANDCADGCAGNCTYNEVDWRRHLFGNPPCYNCVS